MHTCCFRRFYGLLLASLVLFACSSATPETPTVPVRTPTASLTVETAPPSETVTPSPTTAAGLVILLAPDGTSSPASKELQTALERLAGEAGLDFQVQSDLSPAELFPHLRVVVALPPDMGLANLAAAAPHTQFLGIGFAGLAAGENLSVIGSQGSGPELQGFLAGYLAAVITPEWRVGVIGVSDTSEGVAARQGFLNGVVYFCGLCRQTYPPFLTYPMYVEAPAGGSPAEWQTAGAALIDQAVKTVYLVPGAGDESMLSGLALAEINLIGSAPPPAAIKNRWIATIQTDIIPALEKVWPDLLAGKGGASLSPSLEIGDINPELLSPGRQRLVEEFLADLQGGFIDPGLQNIAP